MNTQLERELENQINDDIASLSEAYVGGGPQAVSEAIVQRLTLAPLNRSGAHYGFYGPSEQLLAGNIPNSVIGDLPLTQSAQFQHDKTSVFGRRTVFRGEETLVVARDRSVLTQALKDNIIRFGLAITALLILSALLARKTTMHLQRRIEAMNASLQKVGDGHADTRLKSDCENDEISFLGGQINSMLSRLERMITLRKRVTDQIAHEMRSPLTRLEASLQTLPESAAAAKAREEIANCVNMLDGLLDISAVDAQQGDRRGFQNFDLVVLSESLVELFEAVAEGQGQVLNFSAPKNALVKGDPSQIGRLVSNLLDNAFKYSDPNTNIELQISENETAFKNQIILRVINTGPLIEDAVAKDIFTPFFRAQSTADKKGYGLGLALSRAIAQRHDGQLELERHPGKTAFRLTLPL